MTAIDARESNASIVSWRDLDRWIIPSSIFLRRSLPPGWTRARIGDLVRQFDKREKVQPQTDYKMAGVKWYGEGVFLRETVRGDEISATQVTPLVPHALIYNRLFAWKASFAVVPEQYDGCFVSNEFPQFIPDTRRLLPEYLFLFCTRKATIRAVGAASTGSAAVSRNRFKEDQFLNFEIPLPPRPEQETIVRRWRKAQESIAAARNRIEKLDAAIDSRFVADLGLTLPTAVGTEKTLLVPWSEFVRWGVRFNQLRLSSADITEGKYPVVSIDSLIEFIQYGTSEKAHSNSDGVGVLRIGNIKNRSLDLANLKYIDLSGNALQSLLLRDGDILVIRTSGSRDLVGTCAVFRGEGDFVFASYLIRLRLDSTRAYPEFVSWFLNSQLGRQQVDSVSRQIMQNNINSEELRGLLVPLPPLEVQRKIMERVDTSRSAITQEWSNIEKLSQDTDDELESLIFGAKSLREK